MYFSYDKTNWGEPKFSGAFENSAAPQYIEFDNPEKARYMKNR